ncbi:hypothetical protein PN36_12255 [Candidatus Thiomargarita nelsonii]|uniref:Lipoprotein n=1 Tax=Candidatus Thiomargarita nelsonii TaxID=1003181 RepID=A0A0A6PCY2_9GAMM|nr:hypothetical protein PN36_12255 [Candidatus Thiomargarita nelsonii]
MLKDGKQKMKKLTLYLFLLLIALSLLGCPPNKMRLRQSTTLEFLDYDYFDEKLSTTLSQGLGKIEVRPLTPFSTNDIPARLDAWFRVIGETGGQVQTAPIDSSSRNIFVSLVLTLHSIYQQLKNQFRYNPAQYYNVLLLYRQNKRGEALIEKLIFTHRKLKPLPR